MSVSRRHAIHWPKSQPNGENEPTSTIVVSSPNGFFVDVRCTKGETLTPEWFFSGHEIIDPHDESVIEFNHEFFDSQYVSNCTADIPADIGTFSDPQDEGERAAGIRVEKGTMVNPVTGILEPYVEKWITADPYSRDLHWIGEDASSGARCVVLQAGTADKMCNVIPGQHIGRIVSYGSWRQGVFWCRDDHLDEESTVGVIRAYNDEVIVKHGAYAGTVFPSWENIRNVTQHGEVLIVGNVKWLVIEYIP
ncbi:hypothetical protein CANINC_002651 [Pichia inconspicua]|uniref:Protein HRI1 n=1 Tax=Pichia inconspicua TaxID=52247 RepID=A0A4T0X220_9ASCO|nr:hypothetical protein CANINC_002651 [[Candida] inconspicua]